MSKPYIFLGYSLSQSAYLCFECNTSSSVSNSWYDYQHDTDNPPSISIPFYPSSRQPISSPPSLATHEFVPTVSTSSPAFQSSTQVEQVSSFLLWSLHLVRLFLFLLLLLSFIHIQCVLVHKIASSNQKYFTLLLNSCFPLL